MSSAKPMSSISSASSSTTPAPAQTRGARRIVVQRRPASQPTTARRDAAADLLLKDCPPKGHGARCTAHRSEWNASHLHRELARGHEHEHAPPLGAGAR
jgi:hypothetical protein